MRPGPDMPRRRQADPPCGRHRAGRVLAWLALPFAIGAVAQVDDARLSAEMDEASRYCREKGVNLAAKLDLPSLQKTADTLPTVSKLSGEVSAFCGDLSPASARRFAGKTLLFIHDAAAGAPQDGYRVAGDTVALRMNLNRPVQFNRGSFGFRGFMFLRDVLQ